MARVSSPLVMSAVTTPSVITPLPVAVAVPVMAPVTVAVNEMVTVSSRLTVALKGPLNVTVPPGTGPLSVIVPCPVVPVWVARFSVPARFSVMPPRPPVQVGDAAAVENAAVTLRSFVRLRFTWNGTALARALLASLVSTTTPARSTTPDMK